MTSAGVWTFIYIPGPVKVQIHEYPVTRRHGHQQIGHSETTKGHFKVVSKTKLLKCIGIMDLLFILIRDFER